MGKIKTSNGAKLKHGKIYHVKCVSTGKNLRIHQDGKVDGNGGTGFWSRFQVYISKDKKSFRLQNVALAKHWLRILPNGTVNGLGTGGKNCEFKIVDGKEDGHFGIWGLAAKGHLGILPDGTVKDPAKTGTGTHGQFSVVKPIKLKIKLGDGLKFKNGREYSFRSIATDKNLRIKKDGSVDGLGGSGPNAVFIAHVTGDDTVKFQSAADLSYWLRIESPKKLNGLGSAGDHTNFQIIPSGRKKIFSMRSVKFGKYHVGVLPNGDAKDPEKTGVGAHGRFKIVKAYQGDAKETAAKLKEGRIVFLRSIASGKNLRITANGQVDGKGGEGKWARFVVHKKGKNQVIFQNVKSGNAKHFLRINPKGVLDGLGSGGEWCVFKMKKSASSDGRRIYTFTSVKHGKGNVGILPKGTTKAPNSTGFGPHGQFWVYKKTLPK